MISGSWLSAALDQLVPEEKKVRALISQKCSTKVEMMNLIILVPNIMNPDSPNNYPHCQDVSLYHETDRLKEVFVKFVVSADQHHFNDVSQSSSGKITYCDGLSGWRYPQDHEVSIT